MDGDRIHEPVGSHFLGVLITIHDAEFCVGSNQKRRLTKVSRACLNNRTIEGWNNARNNDSGKLVIPQHRMPQEGKQLGSYFIEGGMRICLQPPGMGERLIPEGAEGYIRVADV